MASPRPYCNKPRCNNSSIPSHDKCMVHAGCSSVGVFDHTSCPTCMTWWNFIKDLDLEEVESSNEWKSLRQCFVDAYQYFRNNHGVELMWASQNVADFFPNLGRVISAEEHMTLLKHALGRKEGQLDSMNKRSLSTSRSSSSESSQEEPSSEDESSKDNRKKRPCLTARRLTVDNSMSIEALRSLGWLPVPSNWEIREGESGHVSAFHYIVQGGQFKACEVENIEIKSVISEDHVSYIWRTVKEDVKEENAGIFQKVKGVASALSSLSTMVMASDSPMAVKLGEVKPHSVSIKANDTSKACKDAFKELIKWWGEKAVHAPAPPPSASRPPPTKLNIEWPTGSEAEMVAKFLNTAKIAKTDFPEEFKAIDAKDLKEDNKSRYLAAQAMQVSSVLEMLSSQLTSASTLIAQDRSVDCNLILHLASVVVTGLASIAGNNTNLLIEEAVTNRLDLRSKAVPANLKTIKKKILQTDPFSTLPCGNNVALQAAIDSIPKPSTVNLPAEFYRAIYASQNKEKQFNKGYAKKNNFKGNKGNFSTFNKNKKNQYQGKGNWNDKEKFRKDDKQRNKFDNNKYKDKQNKDGGYNRSPSSSNTK